MFYIYDKNTLKFEKVKWLALTLKLSLIAVVIFSAFGLTIRTQAKDLNEAEIIVIMNKHDKFSSDKLAAMIKDMNFGFPYIVYAQAILETNNFQSKIFNENNNLFGMKRAVTRINKARGTQSEHAFYRNWMESLDDYSLYSATYLSSLKTENDYFDYLEQNYAEDKQYVKKLKEVIATRKLKEKFN
jgi:uncharacterized FlgJ-related protein